MSDTTAHPAGSPSGAGAGDGTPARSGSDLIDAAAVGEALTPAESGDLLAYFLSNDGLPGDTAETPYTVELGHGQHKRAFECVVKPIDWAAWQDSRERATNEKTGVFDQLVASSWVVARGLVSPKLGPTVVRMQQQDGDKAPADAAALLRRMFAKQSGALIELSTRVLELSKLANDGESSVKEVDAAKN